MPQQLPLLLAGVTQMQAEREGREDGGHTHTHTHSYMLGLASWYVAAHTRIHTQMQAYWLKID